MLYNLKNSGFILKVLVIGCTLRNEKKFVNFNFVKRLNMDKNLIEDESLQKYLAIFGASRPCDHSLVFDDCDYFKLKTKAKRITFCFNE